MRGTSFFICLIFFPQSAARRTIDPLSVNQQNDLNYSMNFKGTDVSKPFSELCSDLDIEYLDLLSSFIAQDTEDFYDLYLSNF